jgi:hypothetical protein
MSYDQSNTLMNNDNSIMIYNYININNKLLSQHINQNFRFHQYCKNSKIKKIKHDEIIT